MQTEVCKKAKETLVIGLCGLYKKQIWAIFHLCFCFVMFWKENRAKETSVIGDDMQIFRQLRRQGLQKGKTKSRWHNHLLFSTQRMCIKNRISKTSESKRSLNSSSPRSISIGQLNTLLCLHLRPIKLVVYKWPYWFEIMGYLILKHASRLDAFSVYHDRTRLSSCAPGGTTGAPEVRPSRSSRTKDRPSQISCAHDR